MSNKLLQRLTALSVMAERGTLYERRNAKILLAKLLKKHGLTDADLHCQNGSDLNRIRKEQSQRVYQRREEDRRQAYQRQRAQTPPPPRPTAPRRNTPPQPRPTARQEPRPAPRPTPRQEPWATPCITPPTLEELFWDYLEDRAYLYLLFFVVSFVIVLGSLSIIHYSSTGEWLTWFY